MAKSPPVLAPSTALVHRLALTLGVLVALLARPSSAGAQESAEASRLRILLVINTKARNAHNLGIDLDGVRLRRVFEEGLRLQRLQGRYTLDVLSGDLVTRAQVLEYYRTLKTDPTEALLFYYAGHGNMSKAGEHRLALRGGPLTRSDLSRAMALHNPRLLVILTECCASVSGRRAAPPRRAPRPSRRAGVFARAGWGRGKALRDLFFRQRGVVDVNASQAGRLAYGKRRLGGGYFTVALGRLLAAPAARFDANRDGFVSWSEFVAVLSRGTWEVAGRAGRYQVPGTYVRTRP